MIEVKCNIRIFLNHASLQTGIWMAKYWGQYTVGVLHLHVSCWVFQNCTAWIFFFYQGHKTVYAAGNSEKWDNALQKCIAQSGNFLDIFLVRLLLLAIKVAESPSSVSSAPTVVCSTQGRSSLDLHLPWGLELRDPCCMLSATLIHLLILSWEYWGP